MEPKVKRFIEGIFLVLIVCSMSISAANVDLPDGSISSIVFWGVVSNLLLLLFVLFEEGVKKIEEE